MKAAKLIGYVILAIATVSFGVKLFFYGGDASADPNDSPLYESTLRRALNNFKQSEMHLAASPFSQQPTAAAQTTKPQADHAELARQYLSVGKQKLEQQLYNEALPYLQAATQFAPDNAEAWQYLGAAYAKQDNAKEAQEAYAKARQLAAKSSPAAENQFTAKDYADAGMAYYNKGQLKQALPYFQRALELDPSQPALYRSLGNCYFALEEFDKVIECYKQAAALQPDQADSYYLLGVAYAQSGKTDEAKAAYQKAFTIDPNHTHAHAGLGQILLAEGKKDEAMKEFQYEIDHCRKAIEQKPDDVNAYTHLANFYLQNSINLPEAHELLTRALALDPSDAVALSAAAQLAFKNGNQQKAIDLIDKAIAQNTNRKAYYQMLKASFTKAKEQNAQPAGK